MPVRSAAGLTGQAFFLGDRRKGKWVGCPHRFSFSGFSQGEAALPGKRFIWALEPFSERGMINHIPLNFTDFYVFGLFFIFGRLCRPPIFRHS